MIEEFDKIGDLFRNKLKEHHIDSDAHLWDRLESQLSAQPPVSVPKSSIIRHLSWVKAAVAASVIISAALAYNYIYLPLKNPMPVSEIKQTADPIPSTEKMIDSALIENEVQNQQINQLESKESTISNPKKQELLPKQENNQSRDRSDGKNPTASDNSLPNYANNISPLNQHNNPIVNTPPNPVNNMPVAQKNNPANAMPEKESIRQAATDPVIDRNQVETFQNITANKEAAKQEEIITDADIPNIFTPNNDGINDYFVIRNLDRCSNNHLVIRDRNGKTIFEKMNYQNDWDGRNVADGVYFFFLKCNISNNNFGKMGSITIKR